MNDMSYREAKINGARVMERLEKLREVNGRIDDAVRATFLKAYSSLVCAWQGTLILTASCHHRVCPAGGVEACPLKRRLPIKDREQICGQATPEMWREELWIRVEDCWRHIDPDRYVEAVVKGLVDLDDDMGNTRLAKTEAGRRLLRWLRREEGTQAGGAGGQENHGGEACGHDQTDA